MREDAALLTEAIGADVGQLEAEGPLERTWRLGQEEIVKEVGMEAAKGRREWTLDGGPYRSRYTRNGRYVYSMRLNLLDDKSSAQAYGDCREERSCSFI